MAIVDDIRAAAVAGVTALSLTGSPSVAGRKTPLLPSGKSPPAVVVAVGEGGDVEDLYVGKVLVRYPVTVAMYEATDGDTQDFGNIDTWRQAVARGLNKESVFSSVAGLNKVDRRDEATFEPTGLESLYNVSLLLFTVEVIEDRN